MLLSSIINKNIKKAIILGSGVTVREKQRPTESIAYKEIPHWPLGKVKGHKGVLDIYEDIVVLRGRSHIYEGFNWQEASYPTQFLIDHGIQELIITNAAGGINPDFEIGDLMQITGYLDFIKPNKARGNIESLSQTITQVPTALIDGIRQGVYLGLHGPNYESDAEVALFRNLGASAVGMSTIPELELAIKHNLTITAVSIITNVYGKTEDLGHEGVVAVAKEASARLTKLLAIE
ncbi:MAG: purine-nucleoside phosphorylase [Candidatus Caenarcaniphilales bacterium]|jgi:purine-nucleoside phosphorylase|nr:purine-nucleoside phosphorylase [Candidatus Caenarcaniphilales bacterium]